jgi:hypothetical protein
MVRHALNFSVLAAFTHLPYLPFLPFLPFLLLGGEK